MMNSLQDFSVDSKNIGYFPNNGTLGKIIAVGAISLGDLPLEGEIPHRARVDRFNGSSGSRHTNRAV
jgi:hypothetical protein